MFNPFRHWTHECADQNIEEEEEKEAYKEKDKE
jgi:hypothetical protein